MGEGARRVGGAWGEGVELGQDMERMVAFGVPGSHMSPGVVRLRGMTDLGANDTTHVVTNPQSQCLPKASCFKNKSKLVTL